LGYFSSEIDESGPQWAARHRDNPAAHLYHFADIFNGFRVFYHYWLVCTRCNKAEQQTENRKQKTHVRAEYNLEFSWLCRMQ
jgi:hypothetical protein